MINLTYLGHASFKIDSDEDSIIIDPYQHGSVPGLKFPLGQECNFLFVSHEHHDHNARDLVSVKNGRTLSYIEHMAPHDGKNGIERGLTKFFVFFIEGKKIDHLGDMYDISIQKNLEYLKGMDVILCPINGFYTMGVEEAKKLIEICKPKLFIPMHYYSAKHNSGYDDNGQLQKFLEYFPKTLKVNETTICVDEYISKCKTLVFENSLGAID